MCYMYALVPVGDERWDVMLLNVPVRSAIYVRTVICASNVTFVRHVSRVMEHVKAVKSVMTV